MQEEKKEEERLWLPWLSKSKVTSWKKSRKEQTHGWGGSHETILSKENSSLLANLSFCGPVSFFAELWQPGLLERSPSAGFLLQGSFILVGFVFYRFSCSLSVNAGLPVLCKFPPRLHCITRTPKIPKRTCNCFWQEGSMTVCLSVAWSLLCLPAFNCQHSTVRQGAMGVC